MSFGGDSTENRARVVQHPDTGFLGAFGNVRENQLEIEREQQRNHRPPLAGGAGVMVLICGNCGSHDIRITDASESHDGNGFVDSFTELYECQECGGEGAYHVYEDNSDSLTGCLGRSSGGVW